MDSIAEFSPTFRAEREITLQMERGREKEKGVNFAASDGKEDGAEECSTDVRLSLWLMFLTRGGSIGIS
jgi:hypothetical protein